MNVNLSTVGLGAVLAVIALVLAIVFAVLGRFEPLAVLGLIGLVAVARLT